jgi:hypothetical protein
MSRLNGWTIIAAYIVILYLTSNLKYFNELKITINSFMTTSYGFRDYASWYDYEDSSSLFAFGNLLNLLFLVLIILTRNKVVDSYDNGKIIYGVAILYLFIARFCLVFPTGFRLAIPFGFFYGIYIIYCLHSYRKIGLVFLLYASLLLTKNLWTSYDLIPYSNSIPYIITEHKPYVERLNYNRDACYKRTGKIIGD